MAVTGGAVARQLDTAAEWDVQRLLMILPGGEIKHIGKDRTQVAHVAEREGEEMGGRGDAEILPALGAQRLQAFQPVDIDVLKVGVQQRLPRPAIGSQVALYIQ